MITHLDLSKSLAFDRSHRREKYFNSSFLVVAFDGEKIDNIVDLRFYKSTGMTTCALWINHQPFSTGSSKVVKLSQRSDSLHHCLLKVLGAFESDRAYTPSDAYITDTLDDIAKFLGYSIYKIIEVHA
jgi:hypothetical protein